MSATDAAVAAIRLTEDELQPYISHASTRRWLSGPGLPLDSDLFTFEELRREGLRTVADATGDPAGRLSEELRDQLVIGGLTDLHGRETESVLLDGVTGEVSTTAFFHTRPDLMDRTPLAPSL
ncbi:hypothetical protein ACIP8U_40410, partial [Streptomyces pseudovenezuelae]